MDSKDNNLDIEKEKDDNLDIEKEKDDIKSETLNNEKKVKSKSKKFLFDFTITIIVAIILSLFLKCFVVEKVMVSGSSMYPTLENTEFVSLSKINLLFKKPKYNDIVVFQATKDERYIKRVIGLAGDTIEIKDGILYRNGKDVNENYLNEEYMYSYIKSNSKGDKYFTNDYRLDDDFGNLIKIPDGYYFVLGDNRPVSNDSRKIGLINEDKILGVVYNFW